MANPRRPSLRIFFNAIRRNNIQAVTRMLQRGADAESLDDTGNSTIHYAVISMKDDVAMLQLLVDHQAEVDLSNHEGIRPYNLAVTLEQYNSLEFLIRNGARIDVDEFDGFVQRAPTNISRLFYEHVNVRGVSSIGLTSLHLSVKHNDLTGVTALLRRGANINYLEPLEGSPPLYWATTVECVEILLKNGADPNLRHRWSGTYLFNLCWSPYGNMYVPLENQEPIIETLLRNRADVADTLNYGKVMLIYNVRDWSVMERLRIILKTMARMEHQYLYGCNRSLNLNDSGVIGKYYAKCLKELIKARKTPLYKKVTFFDIATKSEKELMVYARNASIMKAFENFKKKARMLFPTYYKVMQRCLNSAVQRIHEKKAAADVLSRIIPRVDPRHVAVETIVDFLDKESMQKLCEAFNVEI